MATLHELLAKWEARCAEGAELRALAPLERVAADVVADLRQLQLGDDDVLSIREASLLSGYRGEH